MIFLAKYWLHIIGAAVLLAVLGFTYHLGGASARTELAEYKADVAKDATRAAELATKAERAARAAEQKRATEMARIDREQQERDARDQAANDRLVADLRADRVRLHSRWQAALATSRLSGAVATASGADESQRDRQDSAARIVRAADRCDAQVKGLQAIVAADRAPP